jgi:hypothetical protein
MEGTLFTTCTFQTSSVPVEFEVLTAMVMKSSVLWDTMPRTGVPHHTALHVVLS